MMAYKHLICSEESSHFGFREELEYLFFKLLAPKLVFEGGRDRALKAQRPLKLYASGIHIYSMRKLDQIMHNPYLGLIVRSYVFSGQFDAFIKFDPTLREQEEIFVEYSQKFRSKFEQ